LLVLVQDPRERGWLDPPASWRAHARQENAALVAVANRWCVVTRLRTTAVFVDFVGVYADGTQVVRHARATSGWLVRQLPRQAPGEREGTLS
jgi:hypothetical protein